MSLSKTGLCNYGTKSALSNDHQGFQIQANELQLYNLKFS